MHRIIVARGFTGCGKMGAERRFPIGIRSEALECVQLAAAFLPASSLAGVAQIRPAHPCHDRNSEPASWLAKKRQRAARTPKLRSAGKDGAESGCRAEGTWPLFVAPREEQTPGVLRPKSGLGMTGACVRSKGKSSRRKCRNSSPPSKLAGEESGSELPHSSCARVNRLCGAAGMKIVRNALQQRGWSPAHSKAGENQVTRDMRH